MPPTIPAARQLRPPNVNLIAALTGAKLLGVPAYLVAREAGVSPALLSMIARGRARVTPANARAIAAALGRNVTELFPEETDGRAGC